MVARPQLHTTNHGLDENRQSSDAGSNQALETSVAPTNPMYDQSIQTTRTSTEAEIERNDGAVTEQPDLVTPPVTSGGVVLSQASAGPGIETAPSNGPARAAALVAFAEANGRVASAGGGAVAGTDRG